MARTTITSKKSPISITDKDTGAVLKWFGRGHGVHVYRDGEEVNYFSVGSFADDSATPSEVRSAMRRMIQSKEYLDY